MKKIFLSFLLATVAFVSCKPKEETKTTTSTTTTSSSANDNPTVALNKKIFNTAMAYNDPYTALYAAHAIIAADSTQEKVYLDTLAKIYGSLNMPAAALQIADKILKRDPANKKMLEMKASGFLAQGNVGEALNLTRKLYAMDNDPKYLFQIAYIQIESMNLKDAENTMDQIEKHPRYAKDSVEFQTATAGVMQKVPLEAAAIYLRGYVDIQKKRYPEAMTKFKEALGIYPNFFMAGRNLQMLQQGMAQQQGRR